MKRGRTSLLASAAMGIHDEDIARVRAAADLVARKAQLAALVEEVLSLREPYQTVLYLRFFEEAREALG